MQRRQILGLVAGGVSLAGVSAARADTYPSRAVSVSIGYAPGGLTDVMTRLIAERLGRELGQAVVVENKTGGATSVASTAVSQARADGYSLLIGTNSLAINPALQPGATPRDPLKDLLPIGEVYYSPFVLLVHESVPAKTLGELVAYAKANPGKLNYGSSGSGSVNHLLTELLLQRSGAKIEHIPYRGAAPALLDLQANRVQIFYATPLDAQPLVMDGKARMLAISSAERLATLPDLPSVAESFSGCDGVLWQGLFAPPATPQPVVDRLYQALRRVLEDAALKQRVTSQGVVLMAGDAAALRARLARELDIWPQIIREAGIKAD